MPTGILSPELKSIEQLFSGNTTFVVPKYQRSFAWGDDEIEELWNDLRGAVENQRSDYFLGTIVIKGLIPGRYEIIDGQQRLACISMIFSSVRNAFRARNDDRSEQIFQSFLGAKDFSRQSLPRPKLELNRINNPLYVKYVIESADSGTIAAELKDKSLHEANVKLLKAYRYFLEQVGQQAGLKGTQFDEFLVPLIDCLRLSIKLITIPVTSEGDAYLIFESLNARGKELAVSDLVKNRLYSEAGASVDRAEQLWGRMETDLVRSSVPEYLRHYWIAKKADAQKLAVREKDLYRLITQDVKGIRHTISLLEDLQASARDYAMIEDYNLWPDDNNYGASFEESLKDLKLFRVSQCYPVLLNAIQVFKESAGVAKTFRIIANFSFRRLVAIT